MKKALLFTFTFFFGANLMAQFAPNKVLNSSNKALINDKVIMSGDEVLKDLMQAPNTTTSAMRMAAPINEEIVGSTTYDVDPQFSKILSYLDYAVTIFFVVELSIRFLGEEIKSEFLKDGWNLFDTIIVTVSLIPMGAGNSALLLRLLRIFRVLRLISFIPELRILIESLLKHDAFHDSNLHK